MIFRDHFLFLEFICLPSWAEEKTFPSTVNTLLCCYVIPQKYLYYQAQSKQNQGKRPPTKIVAPPINFGGRRISLALINLIISKLLPPPPRKNPGSDVTPLVACLAMSLPHNCFLDLKFKCWSSIIKYSIERILFPAYLFLLLQSCLVINTSTFYS